MEVPPGAAHVAREAGKRLANELRDAVMDLTVRPVTAGQWPALEDLFGRAGAPAAAATPTAAPISVPITPWRRWVRRT